MSSSLLYHSPGPILSGRFANIILWDAWIGEKIGWPRAMV